METLCRIRDIYRAISEFEVQFMQEFDLSLNEGMLLCTLLNTPKLTSSEIAEALGLSASNASKRFQRDSGSAWTVGFQCLEDYPFGRGEEADYPSGGKSG